MNKNGVLTFVGWWLACFACHAQVSSLLADSTWRFDFLLTGDRAHTAISLHGVQRWAGWAGRRHHLDRLPQAGNGQIEVRRASDSLLLYTQPFSTLYQEWQHEDEALHLNRAFQLTCLVPAPRVPVTVHVRLADNRQQTVATFSALFDPADILIRTVQPDTTLAQRILFEGHEAEHIDLAILAEGYTAEERDKFFRESAAAVEALFAHAPFSTYKERFRVIAVAPASRESGPSIPHLGVWHDTALSSHYDTFYSERYLTTSEVFRAHDYLRGLPYEHLLVLVNTDTYGGGGIYNQLTVATSRHPMWREVWVHEFGHAFAGLADEYAYDDQTDLYYPLDTEPWEANITTLQAFSTKWADLLTDDTPVPTPSTEGLPTLREARAEASARQRLNAATQHVGLYEGGGYQSHGVYRPAEVCRMRINEVDDFCPVCSRAIAHIIDFYTTP